MKTDCYAAVERKYCNCILVILLLTVYQTACKVCGFMQLIGTFWTLCMTGDFATYPLQQVKLNKELPSL